MINTPQSTSEWLLELVDEYFPKDKRHARGQALLMIKELEARIAAERAAAVKPYTDLINAVALALQDEGNPRAQVVMSEMLAALTPQQGSSPADGGKA